MGLFRLLLALTVVVGHHPQYGMQVGPYVYVAVKTFFVVSGFYIAMVLDTRYRDVPLRIFYLNRFLRLYPAYLVVILLTLVLALLFNGALPPFVDLAKWKSLFATDGMWWAKTWLLFLNGSMLFIETSLFGCVDVATKSVWSTTTAGGCPGYLANNFMLVPQAWSISVEIVFYLMAPFIVRLNNKWLLALIAMSLLTRHLALQYGLARWFVEFEWIYFFAGVAIYRVYAYFNMRLLNTGKFDRFIGELSYPIYISHIMVMGVLNQIGFNHLPILIVSVIAFSAALLQCVVTPIDRYRWRTLAAARVEHKPSSSSPMTATP